MKNAAIRFVAIVALMGTPALAADMAVKAPPPPVAAPTYSWTGFYIGGDIGGLQTSNTATWNPLPSPIAFGESPSTGGTGGSSFVGGLHAGYNWQFAPTLVTGIEGDWSWTKASGSFSQPWIGIPPPNLPGAVTNMSSTLDWMSSIRARLGYLVLPNLLAYGTGGAAWAKIDYAANNHGGTGGGLYLTNTAFSSISEGWVVGGGLEWMITNNWTVRGEYLYYRLNSSQAIVTPDITGHFPTLPSGYSWTKTSVNVGQVGLSYKF